MSADTSRFGDVHKRYYEPPMSPLQTRMLQSRIVAPVVVAVVVFAILVTSKPPFVCRRRDSRIGRAHYTEQISMTGVGVWVALAFGAVYFFKPVHGMLSDWGLP